MEFILFHMMGQLILFIQWNFNWGEKRKEKPETRRRLQSGAWQQEDSFSVCLCLTSEYRA